VLVVEDESKLAGLVAEGLRRVEYTVDVALDGEEALDFTQVVAYDAIVLDIMLPRLDGLQVCQRLRAGGSRTPIIMLTARDAIPDRIAGLDSGADDYLVKPFALGELQARLRALLRREAARKEPVLRVGDLSLDPAREAIIESVWGFDFSDASNLVEVYIRRLRRKLAECGAPPLIRTVRGLGYRLQEP
jgi:two-component system response regulator MprA